MRRLRFAASLTLAAVVIGACGTRADFAAAPGARQTQVFEEIIEGDGSGSVGDAGTAGTAGSRRTVTTRGTTTLRGGSGIKDGVIKIGGLFPLSGGLSALGVPPKQAAAAYFRWVNDNGGIDGLKIDFQTCDDKADPNRSATCTDTLVNDGIFVMGPSFTPFSSNVVPKLEKKGVPWIGYDGINLEGFESDIVVTVGAPIQTMAHALVPYWYRQAEHRLGREPKRIGVVVLDVPPARTYVTEAKERICPALGCEIVAETVVTYFDLNYLSICLQMQSENVDTVWVITDPASAVKLFVECREAKYKPPGGFLGQHGIYLDLTVEQSGAWVNGTIANSALLPASVDAEPIREMKRIVGTYERGVDYGYFTELGYASARMTVDLIREALRVDPSLSRASLLAAASRMRSYDCHGLCKDVNLGAPAAVSGGNHFVWMTRARFDRDSDDQWVLDGGPVDAWRSETWPRPGKP